LSEETKKQTYEERVASLPADTLANALDAFCGHIEIDDAAQLASCVHCGLCTKTCHYYLASGELEALPAYKLNLVSAVFRSHYSAIGKIIPGLTGARPLDSDMVARWIDSLYGRCSLCGRCSLNCTLGINISRLIRLARTSLASVDLVPPELQSTVSTAVDKGNNMGIPKQEWLDTLEWLTEELQTETGDSSANMPIDKSGIRLFYTVNPREPKFFPLSLLATAKIFYAAGESWTFSSDYYDVTNYGLFSGDNEAAGLISARLRDSMHKLGANTLVLGECGHGYNANRWEAPEWLAESFDFEVKSVLEIIDEYIKQGRIKLDPSLNKKRVTLHDPCNLVRFGGIIEEQRFILKQACSDFVEMYPNREQNFCCGGGGGQLSMTRFAKRRIEAGKIKADQIRATGAKIVVAPCHNCIDQLSELNKEYKLGVEIKTVSEVVADALVFEAPK
jgi:Fe-S oxidoreductase